MGNNRSFGGPRGPKKPKRGRSGMSPNPKRRKFPRQERGFPFSSSYNPNLYRLLGNDDYGPRGRANSFEPNINYNLERQGNYQRLPSTKSRPMTDTEFERGIETAVKTSKDIYRGGKETYQSSRSLYHSVKDRVNRARGKEEGFRVSYAEGKGGQEFTESFRTRKDAESYKPPKGFTKTEIEEL